MNVVGFLTMLVFGVGYQLLPRLFGHPLHSQRDAADAKQRSRRHAERTQLPTLDD